jgi:D-glycero-alpha-D-manno-heptose 1-phosphate guanylyltransferase
MEAIVLAGGFGKRLRSTIGAELPKPMALVNNRPFLDYIFQYLINNGIYKVILSVFHKNEIIINHYRSSYSRLKISYSVDNTELGTGGAIMSALSMVSENKIFIINGDTYFDVNLNNLLSEHVNNNNDITFSVKHMMSFNRYGILETDSNGQVLSINDKQYCDYGKIDGGIYLINNNIFESIEKQIRFSFNDYIKNNIGILKIGSLLCNELFIDIGTPEDYEKAQSVLECKL